MLLLLLLGPAVECSVQNVEGQRPYLVSVVGNPGLGLTLGNNGMVMLGSNRLQVSFGAAVNNNKEDIMYVDGKPMCMKNNSLGVCQPGETATLLKPKWKSNGIRVKHVVARGIFGESEVCLAYHPNNVLSFEPCGNNPSQEWEFAPPPANPSQNNPNPGQNNGGAPNYGQNNGGVPNYGQNGNNGQGAPAIGQGASPAPNYGQGGYPGYGQGPSSSDPYGAIPPSSPTPGNVGQNICNQGYPNTQGAQANCYPQPSAPPYEPSNCPAMLMSAQQGCGTPQAYPMAPSAPADCAPSAYSATGFGQQLCAAPAYQGTLAMSMPGGCASTAC